MILFHKYAKNLKKIFFCANFQKENDKIAQKIVPKFQKKNYAFHKNTHIYIQLLKHSLIDFFFNRK